MFPMFWLLAPNIHLPWSGSVSQGFDLEQFFNAIPARAGDGSIERKAFDIASYGRQLGWISEVLLELGQASPALSEQASQALSRLRQASLEIEAMKRKEQYFSDQDIADYLRKMRDSDQPRFQQLLERLQPLVLAPPQP